MKNTFVNSVKTIAQSLIDKAGFDKTRSGRIVSKNDATNTYSVTVDGNVYNNLSAVNDCSYNVGDIVKVKIPVNQMSQAYITSAVYSESSTGNRLDGIDDTLDGLVIRRSATTPATTLEPAGQTGYWQAITVDLPAVSGYTLVSVAGFNTNHNAACSIGKFATDQANNNIDVMVSNRTSARFTDLTVTAYGLYVKTSVYGGDG